MWLHVNPRSVLWTLRLITAQGWPCLAPADKVPTGTQAPPDLASSPHHRGLQVQMCLSGPPSVTGDRGAPILWLSRRTPCQSNGEPSSWLPGSLLHLGAASGSPPTMHHPWAPPQAP